METYCITCKKHTPHKSLSVKFFFYKHKFTVENKKNKTKKDIRQTSRHLRIPGTNLKIIKFNNTYFKKN